jgi:succinate dehydrogenase / fumarate reductase cytochrome b subunit
MSLTGLGLTLFVIVHMIGNLLIYAGRDALNSYAHMLKSNGELLWVARGGLLTLFVVHLILGTRLTLANNAARPVRYQYEDTVQASWASRHMWLTGAVLLLFILYHLAHFTLGWTNAGPNGVNYLSMQDTVHDPAHPRADVYNMVVYGFSDPVITGLYLVSMVFFVAAPVARRVELVAVARPEPPALLARDSVGRAGDCYRGARGELFHPPGGPVGADQINGLSGIG